MNETPSPPSEISLLLARWHDGDREAMDRLFALVYEELRRRARAQLGRHGRATLDTATLVHETFLRLCERKQVDWTDRAHFFAVASLAMRQILVDRARRRLAGKRGAGARVELLDEAVVRLDERLARIVNLRFFGGLTFDEAGEALGLSGRTVKREWRKARAFLLEAVTNAASLS